MKLIKASTFVTIVLLNALITLGIMSLRVQPVRGGAVGGATLNGDVNCDDKIDIAGGDPAGRRRGPYPSVAVHRGAAALCFGTGHHRRAFGWAERGWGPLRLGRGLGA